MDVYSVYASIWASSPIGDSTVQAVASGLRPDDEGMCVWREADPTVLRLSADVRSADFAAAIEEGRSLAEEALQLSGVAGLVHEVVAMTEEGMAEWRAEEAPGDPSTDT
jgi:hypothetical protein